MRSRWLALALGVLGAAVALAAATRGWVADTGAVVPGLPAGDVTTRSGTDVVPAVPALALAGGAGAIVLGTAGRLVRLVAAVLLVLAGGGLVVAVLTVNDAEGGWPWVAVAGGGLVAVAGVVGLARAHTWPAPARRYERAGGAAPDRPVDEWTSLSEGRDPT